MHTGATSTPGIGTTTATCVVVVRGAVVCGAAVGGAVVRGAVVEAAVVGAAGAGFGAAVVGAAGTGFGAAVAGAALGAAVVGAAGAGYGGAVALRAAVVAVALGAAVVGAAAFEAAVVGTGAGGDVGTGGAALPGDVAGSADGAVLPTRPLLPEAAPEESRAGSRGGVVDAVSGGGELSAAGSDDGAGADAGDTGGPSVPAGLIAVAPPLGRCSVGPAPAGVARLAASPTGCSPCGSCRSPVASESPPVSTAAAQINSATAAQM